MPSRAVELPSRWWAQSEGLQKNLLGAIINFIVVFRSILWEALPFIILGALIAGLLEELVPQRVITAFLPTDQFDVISEAAIKKFGPVTRQTTHPRQLIWENPVASVVLTRGSVHPREPSVLELVHKQLAELASSRAPTSAADI